MLVSHETPLELMDIFSKINDYDYALVHLFDIPEYKEYFIKSLKRGRKVYLDNSIFELGEAFDTNAFADIAKELYEVGGDLTVIAPDVWNDSEATIDNFNKFKKLMPSRMRIMGVLQGSSNEELMRCYDGLEKADIIGVNHLSKAFGDHLENFNESVERRISFVNLLKNGNRLHILGLLHIAEVPHYSLLPNVYSLDTSYPVCLGLEFRPISATPERKPLWNLEDWRKKGYRMTPEQIGLAVLNAKLFKDFVI